MKIKQITLDDKVIDGFKIGDGVFKNSDGEFGGTDGMLCFTVRLDVKTSELKAYIKTFDKRAALSKDERDNITKVVDGLQNDGRCDSLAILIEQLIAKPEAPVEEQVKNEEPSRRPAKGDVTGSSTLPANNEGEKGSGADQETPQDDLSKGLPYNIKEKVKRGTKITPSELKKLEGKQKAVIEAYNAWLDSDYSKMDERQKSDTKVQLEKMGTKESTFGGLANIINVYKNKPKR